MRDFAKETHWASRHSWPTVKGLDVACKQCGTVKRRCPSHAKRLVFCDQECHLAWVRAHPKHEKRTCRTCKREFKLFDSQKGRGRIGRYCRRKCYQAAQEQVGRMAIMQAMRFALDMEPRRIAALMGATFSNVQNAILYDTKVLPWWKRKRQAEAIAAAQQLLTSEPQE